MAVSGYIGARVKRIEDPKLIRGEGAFLDDLQLAGILHAAFVRSPHGHARIRKIDLSRARALPGASDGRYLVVSSVRFAVWTGNPYHLANNPLQNS